MANQISVGVCGAGGFAPSFLPLLRAHPLVREVRLAELRPERRTEVAAAHGILQTYNSMDELCASSVDAVLIFTERVKHFPFARQALLAGKHVYSAVPMANTLEEIAELVELVRRTGLVYQMGETSIYYPAHLYCRRKWREGAFGRFIYGEGEYYHDMDCQMWSFYEGYQRAHGPDWRRYAGFPPMLYPTHSFAMVLGLTGARVLDVSCIGLDDSQHPDECWGRGRNFWDNPFSSQSALCRTSDGGLARFNEFRRVGMHPTNHVRLSIIGSEASFEEQSGSLCGRTVFTTRGGRIEEPDPLVRCEPAETQPPSGEGAHSYRGVSALHDTSRLPESYRGLGNGHYGSHQFLIDDFVKACAHGRQPPGNVWDSARYNAPGIVAHQSSLRDGERLRVPDFGSPPPGSLLDPAIRA